MGARADYEQRFPTAGSLLTKKANLDLVAAHSKDLMRVTVSVREGTISSTLLLKRLHSGSYKNATCTPRRADEDVPSLEVTIRAGLADRHHDLGDDSKLSALVRWLTVHHEPVTHTASGMDLPAFEQTPAGSLLDAGARWVHHRFTHHHLQGSVA